MSLNLGLRYFLTVYFIQNKNIKSRSNYDAKNFSSKYKIKFQQFFPFFFSGVVKFDPATGKQFKSSAPTQSYTTYFAEVLIAEAEVDKDIVAIHAAMGGGTGLNLFQRRFPTRCFDVGIAECWGPFPWWLVFHNWRQSLMP